MNRFFVVILLTLAPVFMARAQAVPPVNQVSIVALIVTSGAQSAVAASVTHTLESLDAQTLTATAPNASELRSILKRFTSAAIDTDIALVFFDGPVLKIDGREFVAPGGIVLGRPSDLLTKAIPLSALARAAALAANGGAVLVHSTGQNIKLIDGVTLAQAAPAPRTGTSPILLATSNAAKALADGLDTIAKVSGDIELNTALSQLAALDGVSLSQLPTQAALLRHIKAPVRPAPAPATAAPTAPAVAEPVGTGADAGAATTGVILPQIGGSHAPVLADTPAATAPATAAMPAATPVTADPVTADAAVQPKVEAAAQAPAATGLSIDVLRAMQNGLTRAQKRSIQRRLRALHFYRGLIDGIFGSQSTHAISGYQKSLGADATGVLTPAQLQALTQ